jgi:hypothetical protein
MEVVTIESTVQRAKIAASSMRLVNERDFMLHYKYSISCAFKVVTLIQMHNFNNDIASNQSEYNYWMNCHIDEFYTRPIICCNKMNIAPSAGNFMLNHLILLSGEGKILAARLRFGNEFILNTKTYRHTMSIFYN